MVAPRLRQAVLQNISAQHLENGANQSSRTKLYLSNADDGRVTREGIPILKVPQGQDSKS